MFKQQSTYAFCWFNVITLCICWFTILSFKEHKILIRVEKFSSNNLKSKCFRLIARITVRCKLSYGPWF